MDAIDTLIEALQRALPTVQATEMAHAIRALVRGERASIGGNSVSLSFGEGNTFDRATISIGHLVAGDLIQLPQPLDPLPAALATFASIPLDTVPPPSTKLPACSRPGLPRNPYFVGRDDDLTKLAVALYDQNPTVLVPAVATGLGGIGKTNLATEFVYRYGPYFHGGVFWLNCADPAAIPSELVACAPFMDLPIAGLSFDEQVAMVQRAWQAPIPRLLIFDNCEDPVVLRQWQPTIGGCRVVVTAGRQDWPTAWVIPVGILPRAESILLLQTLCSRLTVDEADGLAADLGDLPLALHLAGSYLNTYDHHAVDDYRQRLNLAHPSMQGRGTEELPTKHERDVARTFAFSYDRLDPTNPIDEMARWLLTCAALCAPGVPIPRDLLLAMVPEGTAPEDTIDALRRLRGLGLFDGEFTPVLHRLLCDFVQQQEDVPVVQDVVELALIDQASIINPMGRPSAMVSILPHLRHRVEHTHTRDDALAATLLGSLGRHQRAVADYTSARILYERALAIREDVLGPTHLDTALSLNNLATLLNDIGEYRGAQPLYERAIAIRESRLGANHIDTAQSINNLAALLIAQGDYMGAKPLLERGLAIRERLLGLNHPDTARSLNNLANLHHRTGSYADAQTLYERALVIFETVLGVDNLETATSLSNLATLLHDMRRFDRAKSLHERALTMYETVLGTAHPRTAIVQGNLARVLKAIGDYNGAKRLYEQVLSVHKASLGPNHPDVATGLSNLAGLFYATKHYDQAKLFYEQALEIYEAALEPDHPYITTAQNNLKAVCETMSHRRARKSRGH